MNSAKVLLMSAIILTATFSCVARAENSLPEKQDSSTILIELSGKVPGFTQEQLSAYLVRKMQEEVASSSWHFVEGKSPGESYPNKVVWSFKSILKVWEGGTHNGFPSPPNSISYLKAEVKLYLMGSYQMTIDAHPTVNSGEGDKELSDMVHSVARKLFVENKPDMQ